MFERLFPRFDSPAALRPAGTLRAGPGTLAIRWLGTAGHRLEWAGRRLLLDPFVSRPRLSRLLGPLRSDAHEVERWAPEADAIVCGHAHFDHLLDAPAIARRTGAVVLGSPSTARVAIGHGVEPARIRTSGQAGLLTNVGAFEVELVPSVHAKVFLGQRVIFPGFITRAARASAPGSRVQRRRRARRPGESRRRDRLSQRERRPRGRRARGQARRRPALWNCRLALFASLSRKTRTKSCVRE